MEQECAALREQLANAQNVLQQGEQSKGAALLSLQTEVDELQNQLLAQELKLTGEKTEVRERMEESCNAKLRGQKTEMEQKCAALLARLASEHSGVLALMQAELKQAEELETQLQQALRSADTARDTFANEINSEVQKLGAQIEAWEAERPEVVLAMTTTKERLTGANDEGKAKEFQGDLERLSDILKSKDADIARSAMRLATLMEIRGKDTSYDAYVHGQAANPSHAVAGALLFGDSDDDSSYAPFQSDAAGNAWVNTAVYRGLVGQRGPTEPANVAHCPQDALLPYALPKIDTVVTHLLPAHLLLQSTPDPTDEDVDRAMAAFDAGARASSAKRQRVDDFASPAVTSEALALFRDDFAITGAVPAGELPAERRGVELPHEVRWMPRGPRGRAMARVAVLEHAVARCRQLAARPNVRPTVAASLLHAATALKLQQLAPLYELHRAAECDDKPHPLGTGAARLVTRPCAVVRGTLSFPSRPGVAPLPEGDGSAAPLTQDASLAQAMHRTAAATATLRNGLRRQGLASNVYVAPEPHELSFRSAPTGGPAENKLVRAISEAGANAGLAKDNHAPEGAKRAFAAALRAARAVLEQRPTGPEALQAERALREAINELQAAAVNNPDRPTAAPAVTPPPPTRVPPPPLSPSSSGASFHTAGETEEVTNDAAPAELYRDETFRRIINRLLVCAAALPLDGNEDELQKDPVAAFLDVARDPRDGAGVVTPQTRRQGLWAEMQRHVAVSQDRLWVFVRLMGGKIGGNASEVITLADEATLKAAKAIQEQRAEIAKRVSDMQSKIVETVVASMLKNSKMTMEYKESNLAVIDAEARKELKDLETGASGRPFFEANVALKNLANPKEGPPALKDVLSGLANVGEQMQATLERTLAEPNAASASLVELSHPANSYFVMMRGDALAAIRAAQEKLNCELGAEGARRRLSTWELIEGGCTVLTERFAELCGYLLVQARTSTGVSAMYVSHQSIYTNVSQARVALARLTAAAHAYLASVPPPAFDSDDPKEARCIAMTQGERVRDIDITQRRVTGGRVPLHAPVPSSGWWATGLKRW
jgi:hypothetical protein